VQSELTYLTSIGTRSVDAVHTLSQSADGQWLIEYAAPMKTFTDELTSADDAPKFRDLTGQRLLRPVDPVQRLARPKVAIMAAEFVEQEGRFFVTGRVKNLSEFPACTKVFAQTLSSDSSVTLEQHAGRIGSHRLLPGEASAFRIDFEGYLKIQDQAFNAAYNPEQFSVPELEELPADIALAMSTTVCSPGYYKSLIIDGVWSGSMRLICRTTSFQVKSVW